LSSHAPAPTAIYTLSLHDALPICRRGVEAGRERGPDTTHPRPAGVRHRPAVPHAFLDHPAAAGLVLAPLPQRGAVPPVRAVELRDRKSTRLNSSHVAISYAVFCLK